MNQWVRSLYEKKTGSKGRPDTAPAPPAKRPQVIEFRNPDYPWPDRPEIPELVVYEDIEPEYDDDDESAPEWLRFGFRRDDRYQAPSKEDVDAQNSRMLRPQCLFRWAAQWIAIATRELPQVHKVGAFGAAARPLEMEVPRFRQFRRHQIEILHECADLDLAVWMADLSRLKELKRAMGRGLSMVQDTPYGGVAHHQVDVHILDAGSGAYRGRLCIFGQCPKPGKLDCLVPGCGAAPFLAQFPKYRFGAGRFEDDPRVVLFDRADGFVARPPRMDAAPARIVRRARKDEDKWDDRDAPF